MPYEIAGERDAARFEVVGERAGAAAAVKHLGMLAAAARVPIGAQVPVVEMTLGGVSIQPPDTMQSDVLARLPLTDAEEADLAVWLANLDTDGVTKRYKALPADEAIVDPVSRKITRWFFSCAGFVCRAYRVATSLTLVDTAALPPSALELIVEVWETNEPRRLALAGLRGVPPWPVLLPGHVLRAIHAGRAGLPYSPTVADARFPFAAPAAAPPAAPAAVNTPGAMSGA
jgi:hypothetical protein